METSDVSSDQKSPTSDVFVLTMDTKPLEKFAQATRRQLHDQVRARLEQVLRTDSPELRAKAHIVAELNRQIAQSSRQAVVERVAYTWFNRFCALRYMDANRYTRLGVVSPAPGSTQPEILQEAKAGHLDEDLPLSPTQRQHLFDLLAGRAPSADGQAEAYRLLLVASCNQYYEVMPFLFEKIDDYTELLMPDDLLSASSVLAAARAVLTESVCQDVEVIGWLYQFYISEKKDEVIGAKKPITPENIPAATQLFTPDWIVRYLVQNSLGRLWLLNRPHSRLAAQMEFYIGDQLSVNGNQSGSATDDRSPITDYLEINSPEELTVCDPAVGSGHILTYAFDLLYAIYEEEGYNPPDIPRLILQKNLVGLEIDERAAALAAFALMMKARSRDRRFFTRGIHPAITVLRPVVFTEAELDTEVAALAPWLTGSWQEKPQQLSFLDAGHKQLTLAESGGMQMMREALRHDLNLFREADNVGSLLRPRLSATQLTHLHDALANVPAGQLQMFDQARRQKVLQALTQAVPLAQQYGMVIANPPYMGSKNQNNKLKKFLNAQYADVKADLFSAFTVRILEMAPKGGFIGMMTPFNWMFLSSFEKMRQLILGNYTLTSLVRPEFHAFFDSAFVTVCGFTLFADHLPEYKGAFIDLQEFYGADMQPVKALEAVQNPDCGWFYHASAVDFQKIPGSPIAYWVSNTLRELFSLQKINDIGKTRVGLQTGDNNRFVRFWFENELKKSVFTAQSRQIAKLSQKKWFPYNKGGEFRRWFGNVIHVVNWYKDGEEIFEYAKNLYGSPTRTVKNSGYYFRESITWSKISSGKPSFRFQPRGAIFDVAGASLFFHNLAQRDYFLGMMNCKITTSLLEALSPTLNFETSHIAMLPIKTDWETFNEENDLPIENLISLAKTDWDSNEISWDFNSLPLLQMRQSGASLAATYAFLHGQWQAATQELQRLEEENNRLFINAYGLQDELTPDVPLAEITLTCNPHYRYGNPSSVNGDQLAAIGNRWPAVVADWPPGEEGLELHLLTDTMREFISYAVGCMFGRYSLDAPGLILANQGETVEDYVRQVHSSDIHNSQFTIHDSSFPPDADNAIPMLDGDWFPDDITERFKKFLRITFGEEQYADNLAFIEAALGRDIRAYFLREFYDHHVKMYKKRPIYWLFSSPKGSFNGLIYMHRYRPDTVSVILNDYLREFRAKLTARKSHLEGVNVSAATSPRDKTRALRDMADIDKILQEIREYEDDILYPLATRQVSIDLDDGVKVNYNKFGKALKKVTGLSG